MFAIDYHTCEFCQSGFYVAKDGKCRFTPSRPIPNCSVYRDNTSCRQCIKGFYVDSANQCSSVNTEVANCQVYASAVSCSICDEGYVLYSHSNTCVAVPEIDHCVLYHAPFTCERCIENYSLNTNLFINDIERYYPVISREISKMKAGLADNILNLPVCERNQPIEYCVEYQSSSRCAQCRSGYYVKDGRCEPNPVSTYRSTDSIVEFCDRFDQSNTCIMCVEGRYLHNDAKTCSKHETIQPNCRMMSQSIKDSCFVCYPSYYAKLNEETGISSCEVRTYQDMHCQEYLINADACSRCFDKYIMHNSAKKCSRPIPHCFDYNLNEAELVCTVCDAGYYLEDNKCLSDGEACVEFDEEKGCTRCNEGHILDQANECVSVDIGVKAHNCETADTISSPNAAKCTSCYGNAVKITQKNRCVAGDDNCERYDVGGSCVQCRSGYKMIDGDCILTDEDDPCEVYEGSTTFCLRCRLDYILTVDKTCVKVGKPKDEAAANCMVSADEGSCLYCKTGYAPFEEIKAEHSANFECKAADQEAYPDNCKIYNSTTNECELCDTGYSPNFDGSECIGCAGSNLYINIDTGKCISTTALEGFHAGNADCKIGTSSRCLECKEGTVPTYDISLDSASPFSGQEYTYLAADFEFKTKEYHGYVTCSDPVDTETKRVKYGMGMVVDLKWGYTTRYTYDSASDTLSENLVSIDQCDLSFEYSNTYLSQELRGLSPLLTCYKCSSGHILTYQPFYHQNLMKDPVVDGTESHIDLLSCQGEGIINVDHCGFVEYDVHSQSYLCLACDSGYGPQRNADGVITSCQEIANCSEETVIDNGEILPCNDAGNCAGDVMLTFDSCLTCLNDNFNHGYNILIQSTDYAKCIEETIDNCLVHNSRDAICARCEPGFIYDFNTDACEPITSNLDNCTSGLYKNCYDCKAGYVGQNKDARVVSCRAIKYLASEVSDMQCGIYRLVEAEGSQMLDCLSCPSSFYYHSKKCYPRNFISNCDKYTVDNDEVVCDQCLSGYRLVDPTTCTKKTNTNASLLPNCSVADGEISCARCNEGYMLYRRFSNAVATYIGICINKFLPFGCLTYNETELEDNQNFYCETCLPGLVVESIAPAADQPSFCLAQSLFPNCKKVFNNRCVECVYGYYFDNGNCEQRSQFFASCMKYEIDQEKCKRTLSNAQPNKRDTNFLTANNRDLLLDNEDRVLRNPPIERSEVNPAIRNCAVYLDAANCERCATNYYLEANKCHEITQSISNCLYYKNATDCEQCKAGYLLSNSLCTEISAHNCEEYESATKCKSCMASHPELKSNGNCEKPEDITHCEEYVHLNGRWGCKVCVDYYYPDDNGDCKPVSFPIDNCVKYETPSICMRCNNGYYFNRRTANCVLITNFEPNCAELKEKTTCAVCQLGYYLTPSGACAVCIEESCAVCNPKNPSECLVCKTGFRMTNTKICVRD